MMTKEETNKAEKSWEIYRDHVYHKVLPLPLMQDRELRLAFYAGMHACFHHMADISAAALDEASGAEEIEIFRRAIKAAVGKANLDRADGLS